MTQINIYKYPLLLMLLLFISSHSVSAEGKWTLTTNLQMNSGNYFFDSHMQTFYLYGGLGYQTENWALSANIPLILSDGGSVSQFGNTFIPTQNEMHQNSTNPDNHHGNGMGIGFMSNKEISIGDLYINGNYTLLKQNSSFFDLYTGGYVKVPFANEENGLGTGEFDYSFLVGLRKNVNSFLFFAEVGYLILGNSNEINYENPFTYNMGIGSYIPGYNIGLLLSYSGYSKIIDGYSPPTQLSLGIMLNSSHMMGYNFTISKGFSELTPDYMISGGVNFYL